MSDREVYTVNKELIDVRAALKTVEAFRAAPPTGDHRVMVEAKIWAKSGYHDTYKHGTLHKVLTERILAALPEFYAAAEAGLRAQERVLAEELLLVAAKTALRSL